MEIRALASKNDLAALLQLYAHLHASDIPLPPAADIEAVWSEIQANPRLRYFGAFIGTELIASCTIAVIPNLTRGCRPYGVVENVVTHSAHRRCGHGTAVLEVALSHAWSEDCYKVMLLTGRKDEATLSFYRSAGFDPNGKQAFIAKPAA